MKGKRKARDAGTAAEKGRTWSRLADDLGFDLRSINRWKHREGAPVAPDVAAWRAFIEREGLGKSRGSASLVELKEEKLREEIREKKLKNAQLDGSSIPADEVAEFLKTWAAKLDLLLTIKLDTEAPARCLGKPIAEARVEMRAIHDEIRAAARSGLSRYGEPAGEAS